MQNVFPIVYQGKVIGFAATWRSAQETVDSHIKVRVNARVNGDYADGHLVQWSVVDNFTSDDVARANRESHDAELRAEADQAMARGNDLALVQHDLALAHFHLAMVTYETLGMISSATEARQRFELTETRQRLAAWNRC